MLSSASLFSSFSFCSVCVRVYVGSVFLFPPVQTWAAAVVAAADDDDEEDAAPGPLAAIQRMVRAHSIWRIARSSIKPGLK